MDERSHHAVVNEQFGPRAESYLTSVVHSSGEDLDQLTALVKAQPVAVALDLGSGAGHVAFALSAYADRVVAYDLSDAMVAIVVDEARRRGLSNIDGRQGPAEALPFAAGTFDLVVSRYSTHHWRDASAGLREARRVLKPGGRAIFIDVISPGSALLDTWLQTLEVLRDPSHVRNYSLSDWQTLIQQAGFRTQLTAGFRLRMEFDAWVSRMRTPPTHVLTIRSMQAKAGREVRHYFEFEEDGSFTIDSVLISARC